MTQHAVDDIEPKNIRGFPTIEYVKDNWANAYGMDEAKVGGTGLVLNPGKDFVDLLNFKSGHSCTGWGWHRTCTTWNYDASDVANCDFDSQYYDSTIELPHQPMVYDLRSCDGTRRPPPTTS